MAAGYEDFERVGLADACFQRVPVRGFLDRYCVCMCIMYVCMYACTRRAYLKAHHTYMQPHTHTHSDDTYIIGDVLSSAMPTYMTYSYTRIHTYQRIHTYIHTHTHTHCDNNYIIGDVLSSSIPCPHT